MTAIFKYDENNNVSTDWIPDNGYNGGYSMPYKELKEEKVKDDSITNPQVVDKIISTHQAISSYKETMYNQNE